MNEGPPYRYRNRDGAWIDFHWTGLQLAPDGALEMTPLPGIGSMPLPSGDGGSGGLAVAPSGEIYFSDASQGTVSVFLCAGQVMKLPLEHVTSPVALAVSPDRHALVIADAGRVMFYDLSTYALQDIWFDFAQPISVAIDEKENLYVGDAATSSVTRVSRLGERDASFVLDGVTPNSLAVSGSSLYLLDAEAGMIFEFNSTGSLLSIVAENLVNARGLAATPASVYVGSPGSAAIQVYQKGQDGAWSHAGVAGGYKAPVAALAGNLLAWSVGADAPISLSHDFARPSEALLWSDRLDAGGRTVFWRSVDVDAVIPEDCSLQFFFFVPEKPGDTPPALFVPGWKTLPANVTQFYVGAESKHFWLGARWRTNGRGTPRLQQIRTDFGEEPLLEHLPEIYRTSATAESFLAPLLTLFRSVYDEASSEIDELPSMLDPHAISEENLPWLGSFLGLEPDETLSTAARRERIAEAFGTFAARGAATHLRRVLLKEAGVHAVIHEPILQPLWWQLAAETADQPGATLGIDTVLPATEPQGAVVGSTATLDRAHLLYDEEYGTPLFAEAAHRFNVLLYEGELRCPEARAAVEALLEREKPAHTAAHICVVRPAFSVGWQAQLGVDTVIGGEPAPARLGEGSIVLAGPASGRLGESARVGQSARI